MWLIVEGRSDDMLCVLDLIGLGVDTIPDEGLDTTESMAAEVVMLAYISGRSEGQRMLFLVSCGTQRRSVGNTNIG